MLFTRKITTLAPTETWEAHGRNDREMIAWHTAGLPTSNPPRHDGHPT